MKKAASVLVTALVATTMLTGCGGDNPYCAAIKDHRSTLDSFGKKRTDNAFSSYVKAARAVAATAPTDIKADWTALADATAGVLKTHRAVGIRLEQMSSPSKVAELGTADLEKINASYTTFNEATKKQGKAVAADVSQECDITLA